MLNPEPLGQAVQGAVDEAVRAFAASCNAAGTLEQVLEEAGYRTLHDIIDLEREDFLRLPGIAPEEADRLMAIINELTTDDVPESAEEAVATTEADAEASSEMASEGGTASEVSADNKGGNTE